MAVGMSVVVMSAGVAAAEDKIRKFLTLIKSVR
jgi:hypothetical protein